MSFKNKSATKNKDILLRKTKKLVKNLKIKILGKINKNLFQKCHSNTEFVKAAS